MPMMKHKAREDRTHSTQLLTVILVVHVICTPLRTPLFFLLKIRNFKKINPDFWSRFDRESKLCVVFFGFGSVRLKNRQFRSSHVGVVSVVRVSHRLSTIQGRVLPQTAPKLYLGCVPKDIFDEE